MILSYKVMWNKVRSLNVLLKKQYFTNKIMEHKDNVKETWKITTERLNKHRKSINITFLKDGGIEVHFHLTNDYYIRDAMSKINSSKGFGIDNICSYFLKLALPYIYNFLVCMFGKSIKKGEFPALCKFARSNCQ